MRTLERPLPLQATDCFGSGKRHSLARDGKATKVAALHCDK